MHDDGKSDMIGKLADNLTDFAGVGILIMIRFQVKRDFRAALDVFFFGNRKRPGAVGSPQPPLFLSGLAGTDFDPVGNHEGGIKTHTELSDDGSVLLLVTCQIFQKFGRSGAADATQIPDQVFFVHTDAVVGNREGMSVLIRIKVNFELTATFGDIRLDDGRVTELVARVRSI